MSFTLEAKLRTDLGKGASRRLRHANLVPAIIYGGEAAPVSIELAHDPLLHAQENDEFYTSVLTINIDGQEVNVKAQAMQRHPYKPKVNHVDFIRV
ncbi:50S ribosomal protein L25 [Ferrimonas lipolytica]|uniref:Large ribosomal subunit protein bL25 n=1 Tax=Ferrimonas lipolytica TaxID=2724191 RepID=A0A6H1UAM2_9GAMM|nr:50S ribosomal protein L25 [Ferrimonas lipolytica]QIZ76084.1 50S ribosomal protein L25 [Ferrimonas lipolytica]